MNLSLAPWHLAGLTPLVPEPLPQAAGAGRSQPASFRLLALPPLGGILHLQGSLWMWGPQEQPSSQPWSTQCLLKSSASFKKLALELPWWASD